MESGQGFVAWKQQCSEDLVVVVAQIPADHAHREEPDHLAHGGSVAIDELVLDVDGNAMLVGLDLESRLLANLAQCGLVGGLTVFEVALRQRVCPGAPHRLDHDDGDAPSVVAGDASGREVFAIWHGEMVRHQRSFGGLALVVGSCQSVDVEVHLVTHPCFELHDTGRWHPERPARLAAAASGVRTCGLHVREALAVEIEPALLERVHSPAYIRSIERFCAQGGGSLDPDTVAVPESWEAALRSAGAGPQAVDLVASTAGSTAFLVVRPPGHHALAARAMGFCLFNNIAIAAQRQLDAGLRVAIVDWDVHHGNGTEDSFLAEPDLLYLSFHQHPFYPGTGYMTDVGTGGAAGTNVNVPVPAGTAGDLYREGFARLAIPILRQFDPDWVFVSAGYDAHADDPLAELRLLASDYAAMAAAIHSLGKPVVYFLEGGYDLAAIEASVAATLRGAAGQLVPDEAQRPTSPAAARRVLDDAVGVMRSFWSL